MVPPAYLRPSAVIGQSADDGHQQGGAHRPDRVAWQPISHARDRVCVGALERPKRFCPHQWLEVAFDSSQDGAPASPVIYLDSSVALAHLLAEDRFPTEDLWRQQLVSSRLLEYEVWNRIHARRLDQSHGDAARALIGCVALLELAPPVLARALDPL
jgi:hypothetical protein